MKMGEKTTSELANGGSGVLASSELSKFLLISIASFSSLFESLLEQLIGD